MKQFLEWLDHRTGYQHLLQEALYEPIPGGARWRYVWGSTLAYTFMIQALTGLCLWAAYSPSTRTAWESVFYIQYVMDYGWLVRGIHHFAAQAMVVLMVFHFLQVILDKAYIAPREINFWLGLVLLQIVLGFSLTGYLLPWDQKGYYATQVATKIASATPVVGPQVQQMAQGGPVYGTHTLTRFFVLHTGVLPALLVVFLALHIAIFRRHGITVPEKHRGLPPGMFWPDQILLDAVACLGVLGLVLALTLWKGAELSAPANPAEQYPARPEWYFLFLFRFLKIEAIDELGIAFGAIFVPGAVMGVIFLMPLIGRTKLGHRFVVAFTSLLMLGAVGLTALALYEDQKDPEFQATVQFAQHDAEHVIEVARRDGIPPLGALELMANDPGSQGPRLFAQHCKGCHRLDGHDGKFAKLTDEATAPDLGQFGTRAWMKQALTHFTEQMAPLQKLEGGQRILTGDMATFSKDNQEALTAAANAPDLAALIEYVVAQQSAEATVDAALVKRGEQIFRDGTLTQGKLTSACADCHTLQPLASDGRLGDDSNGGPTLTNYAGERWLIEFLRDPGHARFYGDKNLMPAFGTKLSEREVTLLSRWLSQRSLAGSASADGKGGPKH